MSMVKKIIFKFFLLLFNISFSQVMNHESCIYVCGRPHCTGGVPGEEEKGQQTYQAEMFPPKWNYIFNKNTLFHQRLMDMNDMHNVEPSN